MPIASNTHPDTRKRNKAATQPKQDEDELEVVK